MTPCKHCGETHYEMIDQLACFESQVKCWRAERDQLLEALEKARTYTGPESDGCPLCTYIDGKPIASCAMHRKIEGLELQIDELGKRIYQIGLTCDRVPGLEHGFCPDIGEPRDNLTRIKIALERFTKKKEGV
jgi:hypothetical protein